MLTLSRQSRVCVLGAGSWGTALALYFSTCFDQVHLWSFDPSEASRLQADRENKQYLPGVSFPENLHIDHSLDGLLASETLVIVAVPSHVFAETLSKLNTLKKNISAVVIATKGVTSTGEFLHNVSQHVLGETCPLALLSGPSFAKEVAQAMPTSITLACNQNDLLEQLAPLLHSAIFRIETSTDLTGVALGGLVKNVVAIAVGLSDGLGFGANARAALITRGVQEMYLMAQAMGAKTETVMGLAGLGDMVLTTTDNQSRNRRFGLALGQGLSMDEAQTQIGQVVEGKSNVKELMILAERYQQYLPICQQIFEVVYNGLPGQQAMQNILDNHTA
tara:strand:- start:75780 stop:76781 length:1002 start_codon:yes stop_codon:yes gene_type:complete